ncbi:hypothetical protein HELRODRAFT_158848 [Helobdella robusta]|uniref:Uncharacterized protein n=1 Tax=Helobdella robusta TaxID=6412 RepID=T1ENC1_HELRO|nr:hypothetical protein HELRODRAFT_158848 [Helobdella robusta]ESO12343.1 hypothetical protein HELRODRAFT_158848 [Helobdella robusta]
MLTWKTDEKNGDPSDQRPQLKERWPATSQWTQGDMMGGWTDSGDREVVRGELKIAQQHPLLDGTTTSTPQHPHDTLGDIVRRLFKLNHQIMAVSQRLPSVNGN